MPSWCVCCGVPIPDSDDPELTLYVDMFCTECWNSERKPPSFLSCVECPRPQLNKKEEDEEEAKKKAT